MSLLLTLYSRWQFRPARGEPVEESLPEHKEEGGGAGDYQEEGGGAGGQAGSGAGAGGQGGQDCGG